MALRMRVPPMIIGLTIVSFSTSAPELVVSLNAAINNHPDLAVGNVVGSNLSNIGLILGLTALFFRIEVNRSHFTRDFIALFIFTGTYYLLLVDGSTGSIDGLLLVSLLFIYIGLLVFSARKERIKQEVAEEHSPDPHSRSVLFLILGIVGLKFGADFLVNGSVDLAQRWGISERIISLTVVSIGTSLPELAASLVSAFRGQRDLALGNVIGSNIFNIGSVIGFSSLIVPIAPSSLQTLHLDYPVMSLMTVILLPLLLIRPKNIFSSWKGGVLLLGYVSYLLVIL